MTPVTARILSRSKPPVWLIAPSPAHAVRQGLAFSYGVPPVENTNEDSDWRAFIERWLLANHVTAEQVCSPPALPLAIDGPTTALS
jgi:pyruvate kinase